MFRNLIPMFADKYHVVPQTSLDMAKAQPPSVNDFDYFCERLATVTEKLNLSAYVIYLSHLGAS